MALTQLQSDILRCLAKNRSQTSYLAGGLMLNKSWQRRSDDIAIFHDTDEEVTEAARRTSAREEGTFVGKVLGTGDREPGRISPQTPPNRIEPDFRADAVLCTQQADLKENGHLRHR
jgi:hypothetical protein